MSVIVGLTGGIGSGKSTVAGMLEKLGATIVDADTIVHELQAPGAPLLDEIAEAFGRELIGSDGALDREALGAIVFRDEEQRQRLNSIVHPKVGVEFARRLAAARDAGAPLIVCDIPLLFEGRAAGTGSASHMQLDATIVVWVPAEIQVERTMQRDGCSRQEAERRAAAQLSLDDKRSLADHVIDNSGHLDETERQVAALHAALTASSG